MKHVKVTSVQAVVLVLVPGCVSDYDSCLLQVPSEEVQHLKPAQHPPAEDEPDTHTHTHSQAAATMTPPTRSLGQTD